MKNKNIRIAAGLALAACLILLLWLTLFRSNTATREIHPIPLVNLIDLIKHNPPGVVIYLIGGNIAWFVPIGLLLPVIWRIKPWQAILCGVAFSLLIEIAQFAFAVGLSEIDDLLLNTLGATIGAFLYDIANKTR